LFFQAACCGGLSLDEVDSGSAPIFANRSLAAPRKSRKVGAFDLSNNASSSDLCKDAPEPRTKQAPECGPVSEIAEVVGLHHRYERRAA
jgi:hypothetical protein